MKTIVGRNAEIALMNEYVSSGRAEFVAVFGRRRVGKTFLVDSLFHDAYTFSVICKGIINVIRFSVSYKYNFH